MIIKLKDEKQAQKLKKWAKDTKATIIRETPLEVKFTNEKFEDSFNAMKLSKSTFVQHILKVQVNKVKGLIDKSLQVYLPKNSYIIVVGDDFNE